MEEVLRLNIKGERMSLVLEIESRDAMRENVLSGLTFS